MQLSETAPLSGTMPRSEKRRGSGKTASISKGVYIDAGVVLEDNVKVQNYVSIYHGVIIEDGVFIGPHVCFTNDLFPRAVNPDGALKTADDWTVVETRIRRGALLGPNSTIRCGVTIGEWAMVGAGSVVTRDVPPYGLVYGNPARLHGFVCPCGARLREEKREEERVLARCPRCGALSRNSCLRLGGRGMIPIAKPQIGEEEKQAVLEVLESGMLAQGRAFRPLRKPLPKCAASDMRLQLPLGPTALHIALLAHGIGPGDEVITSPFTFIASANCALYVGARPVFVDIDPRTFNLNPALLEAAITPEQGRLSLFTCTVSPAIWAHSGNRGQIRAGCDRGRLPGPRGRIQGTKGRLLRNRRVLILPNQEHHFRRRGDDHHQRPGNCGAVPDHPPARGTGAILPRRVGLQLPDDRCPRCYWAGAVAETGAFQPDPPDQRPVFD